MQNARATEAHFLAETKVIPLGPSPGVAARRVHGRKAASQHLIRLTMKTKSFLLAATLGAAVTSFGQTGGAAGATAGAAGGTGSGVTGTGTATVGTGTVGGTGTSTTIGTSTTRTGAIGVGPAPTSSAGVGPAPAGATTGALSTAPGGSRFSTGTTSTTSTLNSSASGDALAAPGTTANISDGTTPTGSAAGVSGSAAAPSTGAVAPNTGAISPGTAPIGPQTIVTPGQTMQTTRPIGVGPGSAGGAANAIQLNPANTTVVSTPPPAAINEPMPASPNDGSVWIPGHYRYASGQWVWINGSWAVPPTPGAVWVQGDYDAATHRWSEGHWNLGGSSATR
jgi:hypothetical protein